MNGSPAGGENSRTQPNEAGPKTAESAPAPYVRSPVIATAARIIAPFVMTYGLYLVLFGAHVPGGGFQGGVVVGSTVVLIALAFGLQPTRRWLADQIVTGAALIGFAVFGVLGAGGVLADGATLDVFVYPIPVTVVVEIVEVAIGLIVGSMVAGLFLTIGSGLRKPQGRGDDS